MQFEKILALKASEETVIKLAAELAHSSMYHNWKICIAHLRQNYDHKSGLVDLYLKFGWEITGNPGDVGTCPLLNHCPLLVKQASAVKVHKVVKHVCEGHPEYTIVSKRMADLLEPIWCPFLGTIGPGSVPFSNSVPTAFTPRVSIWSSN